MLHIRKKLIFITIITSVLLSGCSMTEFTAAVDSDLGTNTQQYGEKFDDYASNGVEDIDYAEKADKIIEGAKDLYDAYRASEKKKDPHSLGIMQPDEPWIPEDTDKKTDIQGEMEPLEVYFIDVGQGDCTIIKCGDDCMIIDAGDNSKGTATQNWVARTKVDELKYVIGTHPDADHIGGLDVILTKFDCKNVFMPDVEKDTATYRDVIEAAKYKGYSINAPIIGSSYPLGDAEFTFLAPVGTGYEDINDYSIALRLRHGNDSFLFCGDASTLSEVEMMDNDYTLKSTVYKVSHHGSKTASCGPFLDAVSPEYAVISCGKDNDYGHPHAEVLERLAERGVKVFRTDEQGTIVAVSSGNGITWSTER